MMVINFIFRKRNEGHNSIEELFSSIINELPDYLEVKKIELPYEGASINSILKNIFFVIKLKGIIHITGDVLYIGVIPFKHTVMTIHDVKFIKGSFLKKTLLQFFWITIPSILVKRITVVSNFSKKEFLKLSPWAKNKTQVIHNPVNTRLETKFKEFCNPPVILQVGTKPNKNIINTIKGLKGINCKLIIVGKLNSEQKSCLIANDINYKNYVGISFLELKALYELSDMVTFISLYEGFGMPLIEAQKVGRALITSDRASIPEVIQNSALVVNPLNVNEINKGFIELINNKELRKDYIQKGVINVKRFSMQVVVSKYEVLYKKMN